MKVMSARNLWRALALGMALCALPEAVPAQVRVGGSGAAMGLTRLFARTFAEHKLGRLELMPRSLGSSGGIQAVLAGALDVSVSTRPLTAAEERQGAQQTLIGRSPIVFVTSRTEGARVVSREQVVKMFGTHQLLWPDGKPIYVVLRPLHQPVMAALSEQMAGMRDALYRGWQAPGRPHAYTAQDNLEMATTLPNSLAVTSLTQLVTEQSRLSRLHLDGIAPTAENLRSGAYPLAVPLYLVTTSRPTAGAQAFIRFVLGRPGRAILADAGIVPRTH